MFGNDLEPLRNWRGELIRRKKPFYRRLWFQALLVLALLGAATGFGISVVVVRPLKERADTYDLAEVRKLESASIIYDRNGEELSRIFVLNRTPVPIQDVPQHLVDALVAQEDSRFFSHNGVDYIGLVRAVIENLKAGRTTQGASTITQQLARQTFGLMERSYKRKLMEAFVAQRIERQFSKTEILELYLNRIFFGKNFYGIQAGARGYFGKDTKDLNLEEAATLASLIKSPNNIQPLDHPERALKERNYVFDRMAAEGFLTRAEAEAAKLRPVVTAPQGSDPRLSYAFDEIRAQVVTIVGEERAAIGGFQIYTSIDRDLQRAAEAAVKKRLAEIEQRPGYAHQTHAQFKTILRDWRTASGKLPAGAEPPPRPLPEYLQAAALVIDNRDGAVLALVGGRDFIDSQYNRVTATRRPVGTAFIPFVYASAFTRPDFFPMSPLADEPLGNDRVMIGGFTGILGEYGMEVPDPKWSRSTISAREAVVASHNSATVRLGERVALEKGLITPEFRDFVKRAGVGSPLRDGPATFLGASEARLDEMVLAYSCFPTLGRRPSRTHIIQRITDAEDQTVYQVPEAHLQTERAMDEIAAWQTHTCLDEALHRGTGALAQSEYGLGDFPAAGKTGTHHEYKDLWFLGYTSSITCGVWAGFDKQKTIYDMAFSNQIALPIWTDIVNAASKSRTPQEFAPPESAERLEICRKSGLRATDFCYEKVRGQDGIERSVRSTYAEFVRPGTVFNATCTLHTGEGLPADLAAFHQTLTLGSNALQLADTGKYAHVEPVHVRDPIIVGADPYNAFQPILRARPVNDDGSPILRALPVEGEETVDPADQPAVQLKPPPPLKIEL